MRRDSRISDVLHVLLHMADHSEPLTSSFLAQMMRTHPVVVRRTLGGLREQGLVRSTKGRTGGWTLTSNLSDITLLDIYRAVGHPALFAIGPRNQSSQCLVEQAVNDALASAIDEAEQTLLQQFEQISLQTLYERFSRDMKAVRASLS
ncbi:MAG: Rrf2 family transcriptional regulator [Pseudomonadota bacterium]